jgi:hypothetical protein
MKERNIILSTMRGLAFQIDNPMDIGYTTTVFPDKFQCPALKTQFKINSGSAHIQFSPLHIPHNHLSLKRIDHGGPEVRPHKQTRTAKNYVEFQRL